MKRPHDLTKAELERIVEAFQEALYLDQDETPHTWNPDKEWDVYLFDHLSAQLDQAGLRPSKVAVASKPARNARFWTYYKGSPVKLTMRPEQEIHFVEGGPTDEGYHWEDTTYEYPRHEAAIYCKCTTMARDCDGRFDTCSTTRCPLEDLKNGHELTEDPSVRYPLWQAVEASQRDYAAEAAGY